MMTKSHIRALLHAALAALFLSLGTTPLHAQLTADFTTQLHGTCMPMPLTCTNNSKGFSNKAIFIWDFGNGIKDTTKSKWTVPSTVYTTAQIYSITLRIEDGSRFTTQTQTVKVEVNPVSTFTASKTLGCLPLTDTFTCAFQSPGDGVSYFWDFGDGITQKTSQPSIAHTFAATGSSFVQVTISNSMGCTVNEKVPELVRFSSTCNAVTSKPDTIGNIRLVKDARVGFTHTAPQYLTNSICPPVLVAFSSSSDDVTSLMWDFGDGSTVPNNPQPTHTYNSVGMFHITLKAKRGDSSVIAVTDSVYVVSPFATVKVDVPQNCIGASVTLRANTVNGVSYQWDFGDGTVQKQASTTTTHNYTRAGIYKPVLWMWDSMGCGNFFGPTVPVVIDSLHAALSASTQHVCDSALVHFSPDASSLSSTQLNESLLFHWSFGTGNPGDTASTSAAAFVYRTPGKYPVQLTVRSQPGCIYNKTDTILVTTSSHGLITGPALACQGTPVSFAAAGSGGGGSGNAGSGGGGSGNAGSGGAGSGATPAGTTWQWLFPGGHTDTAQNPVMPAAAAGSYTIRLVAGLAGCFDTSSAGLVVNPRPVVALTPKDTVLCLGNSVTFSAHDGATYQWGPAPGLDNYTSGDPVATPKVSTTYKVQVVNQYGCTNADSTSVLVAQPFALRLPKDTFVCQGNSIELAPAGAYTYQWIAGINAADAAQADPRISPVANTSYEVVGFDQYHCFTDTAIVNVAVEPLPTIRAVPVGSLIAGSSVTLQTDASPDVVSWEWSPGDYLSCTNCSAPVSSPLTSMQYTVTGKTEYGCSASDTVSIKLVCMDDGVRIPGGFTPNNDGMNDIFYPMGKGVRVVSSMRIYGRWGNLVFERHDFQLDDKSSGWNGQVNGIDQPVGSYIYEMVLICDTGDVFTKKGTVILER